MLIGEIILYRIKELINLTKKATIKIEFKKLLVAVKFPPKSRFKPFSTEMIAEILLENLLGKDTRIIETVFMFDDRDSEIFLESFDLADGASILKCFRIDLNVRKEVQGTLIVRLSNRTDIKKKFHAKNTTHMSKRSLFNLHSRS